MGNRHRWCWAVPIIEKHVWQKLLIQMVICVARISWPVVFSLIFVATQLWDFFSKSGSLYSFFQFTTEFGANRLLWSLCYILSQGARGFLGGVLWYSFCLYQCHHQRWFSLLKPLGHSQCYIGISLWENVLDPQTDTIIKVQVKSAPTMAALRVTVNVGLCSHPSTA